MQRTFSDDGNGNLLTTANSAGAGSNRTNTWTSFNLPNTLQQGSGSSVGFKYDADDQRVEEIIASGRTVRTLHKLHPDNQGGLGFEREVVPVNGAHRERKPPLPQRGRPGHRRGQDQHPAGK